MQLPNLNGVWRGYLSGTNRGRIVLRLRHRGERLVGRAAILDFQFGPALAAFRGTSKGSKAKLRLMSFSCKAPLNPLDGEVDLTFNESFTAAEGTRKTDVGTNGICKVDRSRESPVRWFWLWHRTRLNWFYMKWRGLAYILMMFGIALAAMMQRVQLNAIILILLLLPAPLIYARQISHFFGMLRNAKIRKLGPLEFDQGAPTPEITAMVQQQAQENQKFIELNRFFVVRTKHLLIMLTRANGNRMKLAEFRQSALNIDVPAENVDQTIAALVAAQCAQMDGENIVATPLGQAYVQRGIQLL